MENKPEAVACDILVYCMTRSNIQRGSFADLAKLGSGSHARAGSRVCMAIETYDKGNWLAHIDKVHKSIKQINDTNSFAKLGSVLRPIMDSFFVHHDRRKVLIVCSHGCGWMLENASNEHKVYIRDLADTIQKTGIKFDLICMDSCLMATLETMCELSRITRYASACQNYCPWHGVISSRLVEYLELPEISDSFRGIGDEFLRMNDTNTESRHCPYDLNFFDTKKCSHVYDMMTRHVIVPRFDGMDNGCIDKDWKVLFDLCYVAKRYTHALPPGFLQHVHACVAYRVKSRDTPPQWGGLSITRWPNDDTSWMFTGLYPHAVTYVTPWVSSVDNPRQ